MRGAAAAAGVRVFDSAVLVCRGFLLAVVGLSGSGGVGGNECGNGCCELEREETLFAGLPGGDVIFEFPVCTYKLSSLEVRSAGILVSERSECMAEIALTLSQY